MHALIATLKAWQLHPFVDHFTVALLIVAVLADLGAAIFSSRMWPRHMALTLLILGTIAAFGSQVTGGWEAERVWNSLSEPAKELLRRHGWWGHWLPYVFAVLVVWRLLIHFTGFGARSRPIYLIVAVVAAGLIIYQGLLGGDLVYDYGVGTTLLQAAVPSSSPVEESTTPTTAPPPAIASPIPTVFVPTAMPTPGASPTPVGAAVMPSGTPAALPSPTEAAPSASDTPSTKDL
jgi:uncharacterized membrane protein